MSRLSFRFVWFFSLLFFLTGCLVEGNAQEPEDEEKWPFIDLHLNGQLGLPLGQFRDNAANPGFGFGGSLLVQIKELPLLAGAAFGGQWYDREAVEYTEFIGGERVDLKLTSRNNLFHGHLVMRYQPLFHEKIWPYLDGMFGFKHFYTRTTLVEKVDAFTREFIEGEVDQKDTALSYGGAFGVQLRAFNHPAFRLDLRFAYLPGTGATYLVRDEAAQPPFDDPVDAFREEYSPTSMWMIQLGLTVDLTLLGHEWSE